MKTQPKNPILQTQGQNQARMACRSIGRSTTNIQPLGLPVHQAVDRAQLQRAQLFDNRPKLKNREQSFLQSIDRLTDMHKYKDCAYPIDRACQYLSGKDSCSNPSGTIQVYLSLYICVHIYIERDRLVQFLKD